ncbi:hypothetical protein SmJEL517_g01498 [Synchytrium microbalum]|uniref:Serine/threonine-protein phosphatase 2A activator n=1 Tax=Synchytrium microbalum TaxID=1806994 RepID=A0A507CF31_9FUNG|nr:uncharacterized protein SmJEL517_g01498 [Synchytrium microbalum]TPX36195.1 hypothetical protein SmJEL517_g01498 [Synchytrium microbalum]
MDRSRSTNTNYGMMPMMPPSTSAPFQPPGTPIAMPKLPNNRRNQVHISIDHDYHAPSKRILDEQSMLNWHNSEAFARLVEFLQTLNLAVKSKKNSDQCLVSEATMKVIAVLKTVDQWTDEIPPLESPQRFGNKAFRTWIDRLEQNAHNLIDSILPETCKNAIPELLPYLTGAFGHGTRLDYGSGHELSFIALLCCLDLMDVFTPDDHQAIVTHIFVAYLEVVRKLQKVYVLEPAGSHGVWGLDDHQFIPYYWGSSQLIDHPRLKPKSVTQKEIVDMVAKDYMYFRCIQFINEVKNGPFHEHSPMLYDISGVPHWSKVNTGMLKMYIAEVLGKFPVVQHLTFGSLLPFVERFKTWSETCTLLHPDWEYRIWTDEENRQLVVDNAPWFVATYDAFPKNIMRVDSARYLYMYVYGGIYMDLDMECLKPMDPLCGAGKVLLPLLLYDMKFPMVIPNAWLASIPGHRFWITVLWNVMVFAHDATVDTDNPESVTGPIALYRAYNKWTDEKGDGTEGLVLLQPYLIFPFAWTTTNLVEKSVCWALQRNFSRSRCKEYVRVVEHGSYTISYWSHSWDLSAKDKEKLLGSKPAD